VEFNFSLQHMPDITPDIKKEHPQYQSIAGDLNSNYSQIRRCYSIGEKLSFVTPQTGHTQSLGISSKAVPGAIPPSGSPIAGS